MRSAPLCLLFLSLSFAVLAQPDTAPGYIVKSNGDTIRGSLKLVREKELMHQVFFSSNPKEDLRVYEPGELRAFQYDQGDLYRSIPFSDNSSGAPIYKTVFVRAVVLGSYSLYAIWEDNQAYFILCKDTAAYFLSESRLEGGDLIPGNYLSVLNFLSAGYDSLNRLVRRTAFSEDGLAAFVRGLNHYVSPGSGMVSYHQHAPRTTSFLVYAGGLPGPSKRQFTAEAVMRLVYPRFNPQVSINIGLHYSYTYAPTYFLTNGSSLRIPGMTSVTSIPFTFQYNLTSWIIQPYAYAGVSLAYANQTGLQEGVISHYFGPAIVVGGGIEIHPCKWLILKADYRSEFFSQNPSFGLSLMF